MGNEGLTVTPKVTTDNAVMSYSFMNMMWRRLDLSAYCSIAGGDGCIFAWRAQTSFNRCYRTNCTGTVQQVMVRSGRG